MNYISSTTKFVKKSPNQNAVQANVKTAAKKAQEEDGDMNVEMDDRQEMEDNNDFENAQ